MILLESPYVLSSIWVDKSSKPMETRQLKFTFVSVTSGSFELSLSIEFTFVILSTILLSILKLDLTETMFQVILVLPFIVVPIAIFSYSYVSS